MATRRALPRLPGTVAGAHRRNAVVTFAYLFVFVLLAGLVYAL
jgi:hypothetical protein